MAADSPREVDDGDAREELRRTVTTGLAHGIHPGDLVPGADERRTEDGPHATGAHDADAQPSGMCPALHGP
jgi:hypothetical protein